MEKKEKNNKLSYIILIAFVFILMIIPYDKKETLKNKVGPFYNENYEGKEVDDEGNIIKNNNNKKDEADETPKASSVIRVHYLDVGQADASIIEFDNKIMVIDTGHEGVSKYIKKIGYSKVDYLIGTHPHADHIGGMREVLENIEVDKIYMPKMKESLIPTTKVYSELLNVVVEKNKKIISPSEGDIIYQSSDIKIQVVNDTQLGEGINDASISILITNRNHSFLFTGDLEEKGERAISMNIEADFLHAGHHGGRTSNTGYFLKKVNPKIVVISSGEDNMYGHPHEEALNRFEGIGAKVYNTSIHGDIIIESDGTIYDIETSK